MTSRSATLKGWNHWLRVYDPDKHGGPAAFSPDPPQLVNSEPGEIVLATAAENLSTTVTVERSPADHPDAEVAWQGSVQLFGDRLYLQNDGTQTESLSIDLTPGEWQVTVYVAGREEAIKADAALLGEMLDDDYDFVAASEQPRPPGPERWWITFTQ